MTIENWQAVAFNPATESPNQIHSDEMAQAYGFKGALVPGVVISSYLMHPAVLAWGQDWINHGHSDITIHKPLYDGFKFEVQILSQNDTQCDVQLIDQENTVCASGKLELTQETQLPVMRGDRHLSLDNTAPNATPDKMLELKKTGMRAMPITWDNSHNMAYYLHDQNLMAPSHQPNNHGFAHGAFLLGVTNWVLAANAYMNPWVHLQTTAQFFAAVPYGTKLIAECEITDLFNRRGHEFVDLGVTVFAQDTQQAVMSATLRAIYQMRPTG